MKKIVKNQKLILSIVIVVILVAVGFFIFQRNDKSSTATDTGLISNIAGQETKAVIFSRNVIFTLPPNHTINIDASPSSVIIFNNKVGDFSIGDYQNLLSKKAIVIQSYPPLNKNDEIFKSYVNQKYQSNDQTEAKVSFEKISDYQAASINLNHKDKNYTEYLKIINLESPVIIVASNDSKEFKTIASSMKNLDRSDETYSNIRQQVQLIGTLMRTGMASDLYSLLSTKYKKELSKDEIKSILENSKENRKKVIAVNGGLLMTAKKEFLLKPVFKNPQDSADVKAGQIILTQENDQWLISEFTIPKD